jgi:hypothetical protein
VIAASLASLSTLEANVIAVDTAIRRPDQASARPRTYAAALAALGARVFGCTLDRFPAPLAAALERRDVGARAADEGIPVA